MKPLGTHNYFVYILTNKSRTVLYIGVTNDLKARLYLHRNPEHFNNIPFTTRYKCFYLIYYERYDYIEHALDREKQLKRWRRSKKEALIATLNPQWEFLNDWVSEEGGL